MKIAVVGAGTMGSIFGGYLAEAGNEVWLVDVAAEHVGAIRRDGLRVERPGGEVVVRLNATIDPGEVGIVDLALIFVKAYHTEAAARTAASLLGADGYALTLQNGLGNAEKIAAIVGPERTLAGVTMHGGIFRGPGHVAHTTAGPTHLGRLDGQRTPAVIEIARAFTAAGIDADVSDNVVGLVWSKLIVNVGINAIGAVCRIYNIEVVRQPEAARLSELAIREAAAVAAAQGVRLLWDDPVAACHASYWANGEGHLSSMIQDVVKGRPTEIAVMNGAIVAAGRTVGVPTPVNETLTLLVKTIEQTHHRRVG